MHHTKKAAISTRPQPSISATAAAGHAQKVSRNADQALADAITFERTIRDAHETAQAVAALESEKAMVAFLEHTSKVNRLRRGSSLDEEWSASPDRGQEPVLSEAHINIVTKANSKRKQAGKCDRKEDAAKLYHEAVELYNSVISVVPSSEAEYGIGVVYRKLGKHEVAVDHFRESLALDPGARGGAVWDNLGTSLLKLHRYELALDAYQRACKIAPDNKNYERGFKQVGVRVRD